MNQTFAKRWSSVGESIFAEMAILAQKSGAINLAQGLPDFPGPQLFLEEMQRALMTCSNQYPPSYGDLGLREQLSQWMRDSRQVTYDPANEILITIGASEALFIAVQAIVNPGETIFAFDPFYELYQYAALQAGAQLVTSPLQPPQTKEQLERGAWGIDWDHVEHVFRQQRVSMIMVNTPHNPTGKIFTREEFLKLYELAEKHDAVIVSDEVYEYLVYDGKTHLSPAALQSPYAERVIRISSAAKTFGFTGVRVGWLCASEKYMRGLRTAHQACVFCNVMHTQIGLAKILEKADWRDNYLASNQLVYLEKRDRFLESMRQKGFIMATPQGAFFAMAKFHQYPHLLEVESDVLAAKKLTTEKQVASIPYSALSQTPAEKSQWLRFAFCKKEETLSAALARL